MDSAVATQTKGEEEALYCAMKLNRLDELSDAVERAALDGALADEAEPAFHLIEP